MSDRLIGPAKLREQIAGKVDGGENFLSSVGIAKPEHEAALSFFERAEREAGRTLEASRLGRELTISLESRRASAAIESGDDELLSYLVGLTDVEVSADAVTVLSRILDQIRNMGGPMQMVAGGLPETGKTNTSLLIARLWQTVYPEGTIICNMSSLSFKDEYCASADRLLDLLVDADGRVLVIIDEGSSRFGAQSWGYEVKQQWAPMAKRFAKFGGPDGGVDSIIIGHTLMDLAPAALRLATLVCWKEEKKLAQFYDSIGPDDRSLTEPVFPNPLEPIEKIPDRVYDPDDMAPWKWDLNPERIEKIGIES